MAKLWDTATGSRKATFVEERGQLVPECAAIQFTGNLPAIAVASSTFSFVSPGKLTIRVWDIATGQVR